MKVEGVKNCTLKIKDSSKSADDNADRNIIKNRPILGG
jgi:hypothetical protein